MLIRMQKGVVAIHKFKTSIDGYDIEFLIRDKGKDKYLIDFKEDKTSGLSNTAVKKLVGADLSYNYNFIFLTFNISQKIFIFF